MFTICLQQTLLDDAIAGSLRTIISFPRPRRTAIYILNVAKEFTKNLLFLKVIKKVGNLYIENTSN